MAQLEKHNIAFEVLDVSNLYPAVAWILNDSLDIETLVLRLIKFAGLVVYTQVDV